MAFRRVDDRDRAVAGAAVRGVREPRPANALLSEMPSGPLTAGSPAVAAAGLLRLFRNAGLFAVYSCTRPWSALA